MDTTRKHSVLCRVQRALILGIASSLVVVASLFATASSASAQEGTCRGPMWTLLKQDICIVIEPGQKDMLTHSQYIAWATALQPHPAPDEFMEMWGDDFYYSWWGTESHRDLNRWVRSGTNICGAVTDSSGYREIACMAITV